MEVQARIEREKITWFSMWFMSSVATLGLTFFPMFHRLINSRNIHFQREAKLDKKIATYLEKQGKRVPELPEHPEEMNTKAWTASIILIVPAFLIMYYLSRDLKIHEEKQDKFLASAFPKRMFMTQTIPIKKYALITLVTLGIGGIYWLYKLANAYNAHFKAQWNVEQQIEGLMVDKDNGKSM